MKKSLILSDNPNICLKIHEANKDLALDHVFVYATSVYTVPESFNFLNGNIRVIDLKNDNDVINIINNYDSVYSIHSKQLFPKKLVDGVKCFNLHPGFNPTNRGWYPQVFAIIENTIIGATFHEIDYEIDNGSIIDREEVPKYSWDTSYSLYQRVVRKEIEIWKRSIKKVLQNNYRPTIPEVAGQVKLKKDFKNLLKIDLNRTGTFAELIDLLRALSFEGYDNAYFIDNEGEKIFISVNLKKA